MSITDTDTEAESTSKQHWVAAFCAVGALTVMVVAFVLTQREGDGGTAGAATSPPKTSLSDIDKFGVPRVPGGPASPDAARGGHAPGAARPDDPAGGCGQLDPNHPPAVEFLLEGGKLAMGELKQGVKVERQVGFRNSGTGPLCVAKVSTGCGCLKAKLIGEKKRFEPGEEGLIQVVIDTTGRVGTIRKQVTLTTNALKSPLKSFRVELRVNAGLIAEPRYLQFGSTVPSASITRYLILRAPKDEPEWKVTGLEGTRSFPGRGITVYDYKVEPVEDPRFRKFKIRITHPGHAEVGPVRDVLRVKTTHVDRPAIEVSAHINVVPRIVSRSRVISLGFVRPGAPRPPMRARIQPGMPGIEFKITNVEVVPRTGKKAPLGGLGFVATFGQDARGWWVDVTYDGKARQPGLLEAQVVIHTDDAEQPEVRVPIRATIRRTR